MGTQCDDSACVSFPAENVNNLPRVSRTTQVGTFRESPRKCHCVRRKKSSTSGKKEDAVETWTTVLLDFSQNTTIHALRQITEPTPYVLRRLVSILTFQFERQCLSVCMGGWMDVVCMSNAMPT